MNHKSMVLSLILALLLIPFVAFAVTVGTDRDATRYEQITVSTTAKNFTATEMKPTSGNSAGRTCSEIFLTVSLANIRFRIDGGAATTTSGHILISGQNLTLRNEKDIANFSAIRDDGTDAVIHVTYRFGR